MTDIKVVREWLKEAAEDYGFASVNLEDQDQDQYFRKICFHFQQATEKYLKAFVVAKGLPFRKIHDLVELVRMCQEDDSSFEEITEEAEFLTDFYVDTRYPAHWPIETDRNEAEKAKNAADKIKLFIEKKLKDI